MSYPRLSAAERRRLANSERARRAGRNAALSVGVRLGSGPGSGERVSTLNAAGQYEYEISAEQRAVIDRVVSEANSQDSIKRSEALIAWSDALWRVSPYLGTMMITAQGASLVLNFLGKRIFQPYKLTDSGLDLGYCDTGWWTTAATSLSVSAPYTYQGLTAVDTTVTSSHVLYKWDSSLGYSVNDDLYYIRYNFPDTAYDVSGGNILATAGENGFGSTWDAIATGPNDPGGPPHNRQGMPYETRKTFKQGSFTWKITKQYFTGTCYTTGFYCGNIEKTGSKLVCPTEVFNAPQPGTLNSPSYSSDATTTAPETVFSKTEIENLLSILCNEYGYCPAPPGGPVDISPLPDPGGFDPFPGDYPGLDPFDPAAGPEPGGYYNPGPGPALGTFDPTRETCITFVELPVGFNDPTQPGGIAARYQPGQRATISTGGTERTDDAVAQGDISASCYSALQAAGWHVAGTRIIPPYDYILRGAVTDQVWNCLILAGWSLREGKTDVSVVAGTALYRPGAPDVYSGRIRSVTRLPEGGVRICFESPLQDRPIVEKLCWRGKVQDAIRDVLGRMGVENIIFDSDCTAVIFPRVCFPAATPLKQILEYFLDICGFCVFPQFDGNVIVGYCTALNVHWHYHEDVDLIGMDSEYSNTDIPSIIEAFRPDQINRAGKIIAEGYAYPVAVQSAIGTGSNLMRVEVPLNTTNAQVESIARSQARKLAMQAVPLVGFAVPLNSQIQLRHQIHIQRPSLGFAGVYMVTRLAREYTEDAFLTLGTGRWLRSDT